MMIWQSITPRLVLEALAALLGRPIPRDGAAAQARRAGERATADRRPSPPPAVD